MRVAVVVLVLLWAVAVAVAMAGQAVLAVDISCPAQSPTFPVCATQGNVMLVLDVSNGMSVTRYLNMLTRFQTYQCNLNPYTIGLVFYSGYTSQVVIPLSAWSRNDWYYKLETLKGQAATYCCSGRRPFPDALHAAFGQLRITSTNKLIGDRLIAVFSNGLPGQTAHAGKYRWPQISEAYYLYDVVPKVAQEIRNQGVRVLVDIIAQDTGTKSSVFNYLAGKFNTTAQGTHKNV